VIGKNLRRIGSPRNIDHQTSNPQRLPRLPPHKKRRRIDDTRPRPRLMFNVQSRGANPPSRVASGIVHSTLTVARSSVLYFRSNSQSQLHYFPNNLLQSSDLLTRSSPYSKNPNATEIILRTASHTPINLKIQAQVRRNLRRDRIQLRFRCVSISYGMNLELRSDVIQYHCGRLRSRSERVSILKHVIKGGTRSRLQCNNVPRYISSKHMVRSIIRSRVYL